MAIPSEGYARLPEDLLRDLLEGTPRVVEEVARLLGSALDRRDALRQALEDLELVETCADGEVETLCAVDGGFAVERTAAVDLVLSVAVGVEGLADETSPWEATQYEWWSHVGKHDIEAERLARGTMVAQEMAILRAAPHRWRILDGSHLTPVIQLNSALTMISSELRTEARRNWDRLETLAALGDMASAPTVVAMPKYDSSRTVVDRLQDHLGEEIAGDDKLILGLLLRPGERTVPLPVPTEPWASLHFNPRPGDESLAARFVTAIEPLKRRELRFTYFKPDGLSPAFRLEVKPTVSAQLLDGLCTTLTGQMTGPFVREPYPQYLADVMAKSVGLALTALQTASQLELSGLGRPEIAEMLVHSYRTEGV